MALLIGHELAHSILGHQARDAELYKKIRKKANLYEPTMQIKYFRDIPSDLDPHFAAALVFSKHKNKIDLYVV